MIRILLFLPSSPSLTLSQRVFQRRHAARSRPLSVARTWTGQQCILQQEGRRVSWPHAGWWRAQSERWSRVWGRNLASGELLTYLHTARGHVREFIYDICKCVYIPDALTHTCAHTSICSYFIEYSLNFYIVEANTQVKYEKTSAVAIIPHWEPEREGHEVVRENKVKWY